MAHAPRDAAPRVLGERYELGPRLGEGGMGVVYRAHDRMLRRTVAIKLFRDGAGDTERTASETQLLAGLNHPSLVTVFDAHITGDAPRYLVMEHVDGPTLQKTLAIGPLSAATVARVAADISAGLHAVHEAGIVHRDVKPSNVLLRSSSVPGQAFHAKLADFGIAHLVDSTRLTLPGTVVGSAAYLSPEQVTGSAPDPASDVYSLGLVLLEALTGRRAFAQEAAVASALARLSDDPIIPSTVPKEWASLLVAMTRREPEQRPSALDVVVAVSAMGASPTAERDGAALSTLALGEDDIDLPDTMPTKVLASPSLPAAAPDVTTTGTPRRRRHRTVVGALVAVAALSAIAGGFAVWGPVAEPLPSPSASAPAVDEPDPTPDVSEPTVVDPAPVIDDPAPVPDDGGNGNDNGNGNPGNGNGNGNPGNGNGNPGNGNGNGKPGNRNGND